MYEDITATGEDRRRELLRRATADFEADYAHWEWSYREREEASRYHHNTRGTGQYSARELEVLAEEGRPALTFNLGSREVLSAVGMDLEASLRAVPIPVGTDDESARELCERLLSVCEDQLDLEAVDAEIDLKRCVEGEACVAIEVLPDSDDPTQLRIHHTLCGSREVVWDGASRRPDRSDARRVSRSRWISRTEFLIEYPELRSRVDELFREAGDSRGVPSDRAWVHGLDRRRRGRSIDSTSSGPGFWVDVEHEKIRLVRMEYEEAYVRRWLIGLDAEGRTVVEEISAEQEAEIRALERSLEEARESGVVAGPNPFAAHRIVHTWSRRYRWLEYIGTEVILDEPAPAAYLGFSIIPVTCYIDPETGEPYGLWRNLRDPQGELNRRYSVELDQALRQTEPGVRIEATAVPNVSEFRDQERRPGGVSVVSDGALAAGRIQDRAVPPISEAHPRLMEQSLMMMGRIGEGGAIEDRASTGAEQPFTVAMRHQKSTVAASVRMLGWRAFQRQRALALLSIALRLPDHQIEQWLSNPREWQVRGGVAIRLAPSPETGEPEPVATVPLGSLREMRFQIAFSASSRNKTIRMLDAQMYYTLAQSGFPIPPDLIAEKIAGSETEAARIKEYAQQTMAGAAATQAQTMELQQKLLAAEAQLAGMKRTIEAGELEERRRSAQARERLDYMKASDESLLRLLEIWERADAAEKERLTTLLTSQLGRGAH
jgi:hypothetical protein